MQTLPILNAYWSGDTLRLVRRGENGERRITKQRAEHCFFLRADESTQQARRLLAASSLCIGCKREGDWYRVSWRYERSHDGPSTHVHNARYVQEKLHVPTFEADVNPVRRFLTDTACEILRPRACYLDIETDSRVPFSQKERARMLAWCVIDESGARVDAGVLQQDTDDAEIELLKTLWAALERYDQVRGWNLDGFDRVVIEARTKAHRIPIDVRAWLWLDHMVLYQRMNAHAAKSGGEKQSFALDAIAKSLGLEGKLAGIDGSQSWALWASGLQGRAQLLNYCRQDTDLMRQIEGRTGYIELLQTLCDVTHTFADTHGISPMHQVEGFLFALGRERGMHFATHFGFVESQQFEGAFVMQPKFTGIARDVHVADFAGMYPSIISSWNMSPETYRPDVRLRESEVGRPSYLMHVPLQTFPLPAGHCVAPLTECVFANEPKGILPIAVDTLGEMRAKWQKIKASLTPGTAAWNDADRKCDAYKIARNSFYGVIGSPMSRFFVREVAESVSTTGVWLAKQTVAFFESRKLFVGYGDTDSSMATGCSEEEFRGLVGECNTRLYPELLAAKGCERNTVKLEYEKQFERIVFTAAKKYVGRFAHYKGKRASVDSEPEVKGLEWKRGDVARLAREMQGEVIALLMAGEQPPSADVFMPVVERWQRRVLEGELTCADVKLSKRLSKPLREYVPKQKKDGTDGALAPHVRVALVMRERGQNVGEGTKIEYFVVDGVAMTVLPVADWNGQVDRHYVWEQMVWPATERLLAAAYPSCDWSRYAITRPRKIVAARERQQAKVRRDRMAKNKAAQGALFARHDPTVEVNDATQERVSASDVDCRPKPGDGQGWAGYDADQDAGTAAAAAADAE